MPRPATDMTGRRFGCLTALSRSGSTNPGKPRWLCRCDCGVEKTVDGQDLRRGNVRSCGCMTKTWLAQARATHSMSRHPAFAVWSSMRDRCRLPTHQAWRNYGARGITVCPEWDASFEAFWQDMGPTYQPGLEIERIDNSQGYSPANCRWATRQEQSRNKRTNRLIDTPWGRITVAEASARSGIGLTTLLYRLNVGAPASTIFSTPDTTTALSSRAPRPR